MQVQDTPTTDRSNEKFRLVALAMMVASITFGVLELFNIVHI